MEPLPSVVGQFSLPQQRGSRLTERVKVLRIVSDALTSLQNQQSRMNYPEYRRLGLPLTSSHMESTIKELNQRVKGSEKFWSQDGGEAVLQLKADTLCDSHPLSDFWTNRQQTRTGFHANVRQPSNAQIQAA